ncbi:MAG: 23S rRNA (pseudouridine(1915)-N(3))-methyltransferase RlmH, partial [Pseudomonadota bacterium]
ERELVDRYAKRLSGTGKSVGLTGFDMVELPESRADSGDARKNDEAARIRAKVPDRACLITFDERGKSMDSEVFAAIVGKAVDAARPIALVIGGPDGLSPDLRNEADHVVAFGKLTMPHQIVRALVLEQLYRATTILSGHPYHRT